MKTEILNAGVSFIERKLVSPLVLSSGSIDHATEARTTVTGLVTR